MDNAAPGKPSPADLAKGKYDTTEEECQNMWQEFKAKLNTLGHLLQARASAGASAETSPCVHIDNALFAYIDSIRAAANDMNALAPRFAHFVTEPANTPLTTHYYSVRDMVHQQPSVLTASRCLRQGECIVAEMRRCQLTFDIKAEMAQLRDSDFFRHLTKGIRKELGRSHDEFMQELMRRDHWRPLAERCDVALVDDLLADNAADILRRQGFNAFAHFLTIAILLQRNTIHSRNRIFTDEDYAKAIGETLDELHSTDTAHLLGIWYEWHTMQQNRTRSLKAFTNIVNTSHAAQQQQFTISDDSQFRKRANDPYLSKMAPEEWLLDVWENKGQQQFTKTERYLERMQIGAATFQRHLDQII